MKISRIEVASVALVSTILAIGSISPAAQATPTGTMALYFSAPFVTGSHVTASANTENFNGASCPTNPISGSWYTAQHLACEISISSGTSTGNSEQEIGAALSSFAWKLRDSEFTFSDNVKYVGVWWMMGSVGNGIEFKDGSNNIVATLNVNEVVSFLGLDKNTMTSSDTRVVETVDGRSHFRKHYYRSPANYTGTLAAPIMDYSVSRHANEPWVYLNLFVSGDLGIKKVRFTGNDFEADNLTVSTVEATPRGDMVFVKGVAGKSVQYLPGASGVTGSTALQGSNSPTNLRSNGFNRAGYDFAGWNTRLDGQGASYEAGENYEFASDMTLYAQWVPSSSQTNSLAQTGSSEATLFLPALALASIGLGMIYRSNRRNIRPLGKKRLPSR
jgi:hypothetical protein